MVEKPTAPTGNRPEGITLLENGSFGRRIADRTLSEVVEEVV